MNTKSTHTQFWLLIMVTLALLGTGLTISAVYIQQWVATLWQICQDGVQQLLNSAVVSWQLIIPTVILLIVGRAGWSIIWQLLATRQLVRLFYPLRQPPPANLLALLNSHNLTSTDLVYLNLSTAQAFCLGFFRPRIWLTQGMVNLLSAEELAAVIAHEAHHCRQYDPMRLLISRTLKSAFFFLPTIGDLAQTTELQQELAADQSAITHLADDLPLLCAIQKLLQQGQTMAINHAAYSPFNATEARIQQLIQATPVTKNWRKRLANGLLSIGIVLLLGSTVLFSTAQPIKAAHTAMTPASQAQIDACNLDMQITSDNQLSLISYNW